jgi:hypothetical protein
MVNNLLEPILIDQRYFIKLKSDHWALEPLKKKGLVQKDVFLVNRLSCSPHFKVEQKVGINVVENFIPCKLIVSSLLLALLNFLQQRELLLLELGQLGLFGLEHLLHRGGFSVDFCDHLLFLVQHCIQGSLQLVLLFLQVLQL